MTKIFKGIILSTPRSISWFCVLHTRQYVALDYITLQIIRQFGGLFIPPPVFCSGFMALIFDTKAQAVVTDGYVPCGLAVKTAWKTKQVHAR